MSSLTRLAVLGGTGGLGQEIVKQALAQNYAVTAVVRDLAKATSLLPGTVNLKVVASVDESSLPLLVDALTGQDILIEVIDNSDRVAKVGVIVQAATQANVKSFIVCGGAGTLKMSADENAQRLYEILGDSIGTWLKPVTLMHLETQKVAFASSIPVVAQISPPGMSDGPLTASFEPIKDLVAGVNSASYSDVANVILQALPSLDKYNRSMIGLSPRK